jgi:hypothetical protein
MWGRFLQWWHARSKKAQIGIAIGTILTFFILVVALSSGGDDGSSNEASPPPPAAESNPPPPPPPPSAEEPPPPPPAATPKDRVRDEIGDTVDASGYAGDLEVSNVSFEGDEAYVTLTTPEGGLQGASCEDLDDGAEAVFAKLYDDAGWKRGAVVIYKGGLVDSSTGEDLPNVNTGIYTMPARQAKRIDWSDDDVILVIDWSIYRDFCHPALKQ